MRPPLCAALDTERGVLFGARSGTPWRFAREMLMRLSASPTRPIERAPKARDVTIEVRSRKFQNVCLWWNEQRNEHDSRSTQRMSLTSYNEAISIS